MTYCFHFMNTYSKIININKIFIFFSGTLKHSIENMEDVSFNL